VFLLDNIIRGFALSDRYVRTVLSVEILDAGLVRSALIDIGDARKPIVLDRTRKETTRRKFSMNLRQIFPNN